MKYFLAKLELFFAAYNTGCTTAITCKSSGVAKIKYIPSFFSHVDSFAVHMRFSYFKMFFHLINHIMIAS